MNPCCKHLIQEAKKELGFKDKRIAHLESEVTRLFDPVRQYWNQEIQEEIKKLKDGNEKLGKEVTRLKEFEWMYNDLNK